MKNNQCKLFPIYAYIGGVVCIGCTKNGRVLVNQCEDVETCLQKLYKDDQSKLKQKINEVRSIKKRINAIDKISEKTTTDELSKIWVDDIRG